MKLEKINDKEYLLTFNQNQILKGTIEKLEKPKILCHRKVVDIDCL